MPFGKHKGKALCDIPADYLLWASSIEDLRDRYGNLADEIKKELDRRFGQEREPDFSVRPQGINVQMALEVVASGYRNLAAKFHPDRGGDAMKMVSLNLTVEALRKMLKS